MKKLIFFTTTILATSMAVALPYQITREAELVSGGTNVAEPGTSTNQVVTRTTDGIYTWWVTETQSMQPGSYTVYARIALAPGVTTPRNFGFGAYYNEVNISTQQTLISNKAYKWVIVGSVDLKEVGKQLRISDWSAAGLAVDKVAILKDISIEAEAAAGGTVITDLNASNQKAVTSTTVGNYVWWLPATNDMRSGDYTVHASLSSADGASHAFGGHIVLNGNETPVVTRVVSNTGYQWYPLNNFVYTGPSQSVRFSDYSDAKLKVDRIKLVRSTPYDENSTLQSLFAGGRTALGDREQVIWRGSLTDRKLKDPGRVAVVQVNANTVYAYFRQEIDWRQGQTKTENKFDLFMAVSNDGGRNFTVSPTPIITRAGTGLDVLVDPSVVRRPDGYYMVFEGGGNGCTWTSRSAFSADGVNNWQFRNTPVCTTNYDISGSVPNYFVDVENGNQYLQWVSVDTVSLIALQYQATISSLWTGTLNFSNTSAMQPYALPRSSPGQWDYINSGSGSVMYEDGHYYRVYEGATSSECKGQWGLGIMRTATPSTLSSWTRSSHGPYLQAAKADNCWMQYPVLAKINGSTFLYYNYGIENWVDEQTGNYNTLATYRHKLIQN
ncbi:hypothetical protein ACFOY5_14290 [Massilia aurea]|uniref:hypothetical protein n=1 Tax=Massilia aurea TaxID=373040 RepID=UPI0021633C90|nr:hypothetical protein [Massilia aurea]MCS0705933.1 hypothetical protein [Massilia aurea]